MTSLSSDTLHATCVAIAGRGVLIEGPSGAGKSDLALRLIDRGARLVSDDYTHVERRGDALFARAPARIANTMEIRGLGLIAVDALDEAVVALIVSLGGDVPRMPDDDTIRTVAGVAVPVVALDGHHASTPIKVERALALFGLAV